MEKILKIEQLLEEQYAPLNRYDGNIAVTLEKIETILGVSGFNTRDHYIIISEDVVVVYDDYTLEINVYSRGVPPLPYC